MVLGDLHQNEKLLDEAIAALDDSTTIIFLGDLFHPHGYVSRDSIIDLTFKVKDLMDRGKLIWICGNHDYVQFLVSYAIINGYHSTYEYDEITNKQKHYCKDNGYYIKHSLRQYESNPKAQATFVNMFLDGKIIFCKQLGDKVFSHSCIYEDSCTVRNNEEFVEKCRKDIATIEENNGLFDFSGATKGVWYHIKGNIFYRNLYKHYKIEKGSLMYKENYVGHTSLMSIYAVLDNMSIIDKDDVKKLNDAISKDFKNLSVFYLSRGRKIYVVDTTGMTNYHKKWLIVEA